MTAESQFFDQVDVSLLQQKHPLPTKPGSGSPASTEPVSKRQKTHLSAAEAIHFIPQEQFLEKNPFPIQIVIQSAISGIGPLEMANVFVNARISDVKSRIQQETQLAKGTFELILEYQGHSIPLVDKHTLAFYNINEESRLTVRK